LKHHVTGIQYQHTQARPLCNLINHFLGKYKSPANRRRF